MKKALVLLVVFGGLIAYYSTETFGGMASFCLFGERGDNNVISQERQPGSFEGVKISQGIEATLKYDSTPSVTITVDSNLLEFVITEIKEGILTIKYEGEICPSHNAKAFINYDILNMLTTSSGATAESADSVALSNLILSASSGSEIRLIGIIDTLSANCSSGASISLEGEGVTTVASASSGSEFNGENFTTREGNLSASSGAVMDIVGGNNLILEASSGGAITYYGDSVKVSQNVSSGGEIESDN